MCTASIPIHITAKIRLVSMRDGLLARLCHRADPSSCVYKSQPKSRSENGYMFGISIIVTHEFDFYGKGVVLCNVKSGPGI